MEELSHAFEFLRTQHACLNREELKKPWHRCEHSKEQLDKENNERDVGWL